MRAAVYRKYGGPEVVSVEEMDAPRPKGDEILVRVAQASVTTGDWRIREAAFPGIFAIPGRLAFGLFRPRQPVLGGDFAGEVVAVGPEVTQFEPGDRVFGFRWMGAHAEYLCMSQEGAVIRIPEGMGMAEAAALPFGGLSALVFLRDFAKLQRGERVLVIGASGGVGAYAVQIARAMGAEVTGICSAGNAEMVRRLGAARVIDYRNEAFETLPERYDLVFDAVGVARFRQARKVLVKAGRFVQLTFGIREIFQALLNPFRRGPKILVGVNGETKQDLQTLADMVSEGQIAAQIDSHYDLAGIRAAHAHAESRHRRGAVILDIAPRAA